MTDIFEAASWLSKQLSDMGFDHCFIGGVALQAWGEVRVTRDVDVTVMTNFEDEAGKVRRIFDRIPPRICGAIEHALQYRVLLCEAPGGVGIDIGLGGFPYEIEALQRKVEVELVEGVRLPLVGPEDLLIMKVFAGRPRDWDDVGGIIARQSGSLNWELVYRVLPELLDAIDAPERMGQLELMRTW